MTGDQERPIIEITIQLAGVFSILFYTLREGDRVSFSPHPPRSGPPSPRGEGLNTLEIGAGAHISGAAIAYCLLPIASVHRSLVPGHSSNSSLLPLLVTPVREKSVKSR